MMGVHLLKYGLCTNILILCDDIASNPGSVDLMVDLSSSDSSFYSASDKENYSMAYFNLGLGDKGLRIGHWDVNYLTTVKFEQIELYLLGNSSYAKPQLDALFLNETFLKSSIPDYALL